MQEKYLISYEIEGAQDNVKIYENQNIEIKFIIKNNLGVKWFSGEVQATLRDIDG